MVAKKEEKDWKEKVKYIYNFHIISKRIHPKWRVRDTADHFEISLGMVSESLLIGSWLRTHEEELSKFDYRVDVLNYIKDKEQKQLRTLD